MDDISMYYFITFIVGAISGAIGLLLRCAERERREMARKRKIDLRDNHSKWFTGGPRA